MHAALKIHVLVINTRLACCWALQSMCTEFLIHLYVCHGACLLCVSVIFWHSLWPAFSCVYVCLGIIILFDLLSSAKFPAEIVYSPVLCTYCSFKFLWFSFDSEAGNFKEQDPWRVETQEMVWLGHHRQREMGLTAQQSRCLLAVSRWGLQHLNLRPSAMPLWYRDGSRKPAHDVVCPAWCSVASSLLLVLDNRNTITSYHSPVILSKFDCFICR